MDAFSQREDDRWSRMTESIDLLFSRVAGIDRTQQHMASQLDLSTKVMDQVLQDQQTLAKQMEVTSTMWRAWLNTPITRLLQRFDLIHPLLRRYLTPALCILIIAIRVSPLALLDHMFLRCCFLCSLVSILRYGKINV
jgi:hypothetical protein